MDTVSSAPLPTWIFWPFYSNAATRHVTTLRGHSRAYLSSPLQSIPSFSSASRCSLIMKMISASLKRRLVLIVLLYSATFTAFSVFSIKSKTLKNISLPLPNNPPFLQIHTVKGCEVVFKHIRASQISVFMVSADGLTSAESLFVVLHYMTPSSCRFWMVKYPVEDCRHAWQSRAAPFHCLCRAGWGLKYFLFRRWNPRVWNQLDSISESFDELSPVSETAFSKSCHW